jgi:hypothetical protein
MIREALIAATPANKIWFRIHEEAQGYQQILFEYGALVVQCKPDRFWTNINEIANCKIEAVIPSNGLPLVLQKNIRDNESKLKQHLQKIKEVSGGEYFFETDFFDVLEKVTATQPSYKDRLGEILFDSYMSNVASM